MIGLQTTQGTRSRPRSDFGLTMEVDTGSFAVEASDLNLTGQPGEEVTQTISLRLDEDPIFNDPDLCFSGNTTGVTVNVSTLIMLGPAEEVDRFDVCIPGSFPLGPPQETESTFLLPQDPGSYEMLIVLTLPESGRAITNLGPFTLTVEDPSGGNGGNGGVGFDPEVADMSVSPGGPWDPNELVEVTVMLENIGGATGRATRGILVNGVSEATVTAELDPGEVETETEFVRIPNETPTTIRVENSNEQVTDDVNVDTGNGGNGGNGDDGGNGGNGGNGDEPPTNGNGDDVIGVLPSLTREQAFLGASAAIGTGVIIMTRR